jgi:hypothetical protein
MPSKKLASLIQSVPPATARAIQDISPAAPEEPEVPLQVLVPAHIREALGIMVAKERGASLRSLILRAVRSLGIEVTEEEIKGKRGRKKGMKS